MRGAWQEYDTTLVEQEDGSIAPAAVPDGVVLAGEVEGSSAEPAPVAEVAAGEDASVAVAWEGSLPAPVLEGSAATYAGAWPGSIWWSTRRGTASSAHCSTPADSDPFYTLSTPSNAMSPKSRAHTLCSGEG